MSAAAPAPPDPGVVADRPPLRARDVVLSLLGLTAVAVAQPLLDVVGRNPAFLVAHQMTAVDVVALALGSTLVLPLAVAAVVVLVGRLRPAGAVALHAVAVAVLSAALVLVALRVGGAGRVLGGVASLAVAAALGGTVAAAYVRSGTVRGMVNLTALAAPVVAGMFILASPARGLVVPPPAAAPIEGLPSDAAPVVLVVFDELPLVSLLDGHGRIDRRSYPAFARLASDATFFRNATTVAGFTPDAVPALLTGRYGHPQALPTVADHPSNLFTLLSDAYDVHVLEPVTDLCTAALCGAGDRQAAPDRYATLVRDLGVVQAHLVVPSDLAGRLPPLDQGWRGFGAAGEAQDAGKGKRDAFLDRFHREAGEDLPAQFADFVDGISVGPRPGLHVVHALLPHRPWRYLPDGRVYAGTAAQPGSERRRWSDPWLAAQGYQRHLLQVRLADRLLGSLLDRLEQLDMYDRSMVVVVADHGISFQPGTSLRAVSDRTWGETGAVPLLVKVPQQAGGRVSDRPVETVDVLPTILDGIGADVPSGIDGRSALSAAEPRTVKTFQRVTGEQLRFPPAGDEKWPALDRKLALFGDSSGTMSPYRLAPPGTRRLLGRSAPASPATAAGWAASLDRPAYLDDAEGAAGVPVMVSGTVRSPETAGSASLAIVVDGTVAAVTRADPGAQPDRPFRAMVPPRFARGGAEKLAVMLIEPDGRLMSLPAP